MKLHDGTALDTITFIMSGKEWSADTLDRIAEIIRETGRVIAEPVTTDEGV